MSGGQKQRLCIARDLLKLSLIHIYYEDAEATAAAIDEDGWFNSGDIGYMDEDGFIYITGRSKNVIVTQNGKNIYPEEIETLLSKVEEIKECMVYGKEVAGEKELIITDVYKRQDIACPRIRAQSQA